MTTGTGTGEMAEGGTSGRFAVGNMADISHGSIRTVQVAGREIGIVRWNDRVFAIRNVCPHAAGTVCGKVRAHLVADSGGRNLDVDPARPLLVCAWHKWAFDLHDGRSLFDPRLRVKSYRTEISDDGTIWVNT